MYWYTIYFKGREEPEVFKGKLVYFKDGITVLRSESGAELSYESKNVLFMWKKGAVDD